MSQCARSRLIKWCAKAARQHDYDGVLSFLGVARDVSFPVRILDENSFSRRKASHLSIARFKFHVAASRVASMSSMGLFAPIGEVDMKSPPGPVRASRTDRRSDRSRP